jgi:uncharacterized membrane protein
MGYHFVSVRGMGWNLFLALVPLMMAIALFRRRRPPGALWWAGFLAFVLFLPNSAYVLTDVVQFVRHVRKTPYVSAWTVGLELVPIYGLFMLAGFQAHVASITLLTRYLRALGSAQWVVPTEMAFNLAVAVGIYLGRFRRFNSWDILHDPMRLGYQTLDDLTTAGPLQIIAIAFCVVSGLYYATRTLNRALAAYWRVQRFEGPVPARTTARPFCRES